MFSGSLLTSWGDTCYVWLAMEMWYQWVAHSLRAAGRMNELDHWKSIWPLPLLIYGDDLLTHLPSYVYPYWVGKLWEDREPGDKPRALSAFLKGCANIELKMEESDVFDSIASVPDSRGGLSKRGPKFLQRYFVWDRASQTMMDEMPGAYPMAFSNYRVTTDYYTKAALTVSGATLSHYVLKLRGLAVDTAGANYEAYEFLKIMHDEICNDFPDLAYRIENINTGSPEFDDLRKRSKPNDIAIGELKLAFPSWDRLRHHFWPTVETVNDAMSRSRRTGFYGDEFDFYTAAYSVKAEY